MGVAPVVAQRTRVLLVEIALGSGHTWCIASGAIPPNSGYMCNFVAP